MSCLPNPSFPSEIPLSMDLSSPEQQPQSNFPQLERQALLNRVKSWWKPTVGVLAVVLVFAWLSGPSKAQKKEVEHVLEQVRELVIDGFRIEMSDNVIRRMI